MIHDHGLSIAGVGVQCFRRRVFGRADESTSNGEDMSCVVRTYSSRRVCLSGIKGRGGWQHINLRGSLYGSSETGAGISNPSHAYVSVSVLRICLRNIFPAQPLQPLHRRCLQSPIFHACYIQIQRKSTTLNACPRTIVCV